MASSVPKSCANSCNRHWSRSMVNGWTIDGELASAVIKASYGVIQVTVKWEDAGFNAQDVWDHARGSQQLTGESLSVNQDCVGQAGFYVRVLCDGKITMIGGMDGPVDRDIDAFTKAWTPLETIVYGVACVAAKL